MDPPVTLPRRASTKRQASQPPASRPARPAKRARVSVSPAVSEDDEDCLLSAPHKPRKRAAPKRKAAKPDSEDDDLAAPEEDDKSAGRSFKEGQKNVCPPMGDPSRAFYESLIQEKPTSIIAVKWCVEHGVLIGSQHKLALKYYQALKAAGAFRPGNMGGLKPDFADVFA